MGKKKIVDTSKRIEEVLLLLLSDNDDLRQRLEAEAAERKKETAELREGLEKETGDLKEKLDNEIAERKADRDRLQNAINENASKGKDEMNELREMILQERDERKEEAKTMDDFFRTENDQRKKNLDDVNEWIRVENEKRQKEAEELRERMEREKRELQEFIDKDNKRKEDQMAAETEERQRKEEELKKRLQEAQEASENGTIQLYKKMAMENAARESEIAELRDLLNKAEAGLSDKIVKEKDDVIDRLQKENQELKNKLASEKDFLQGNIDGNHNHANRRINELAEKLKEHALLRNLMSQPLSIYFDAFRTEDYDDGGEEYLTFTGTKTNLGGGMDAKSGVFTAPMSGAYMFTIHVCTHDMKKGLLSLRCNGNEVASFYDQNHDSNHKNSMVGQSVVVELGQGDKIQIYMFTPTGIMDKRSNWLTHFVGMFLRPKDFMVGVESSLDTPATILC